jgi:hypothetical protein
MAAASMIKQMYAIRSTSKDYETWYECKTDTEVHKMHILQQNALIQTVDFQSIQYAWYMHISAFCVLLPGMNLWSM